MAPVSGPRWARTGQATTRMKMQKAAKVLNIAGLQKKRACPEAGPSQVYFNNLEADLQAQLHLAGIESSACLAESPSIVEFVVACAFRTGKLEIGVVEDVEHVPLHAQFEALGQGKVLGQGHVRTEEARSNELVAAQVADAA